MASRKPRGFWRRCSASSVCNTSGSARLVWRNNASGPSCGRCASVSMVYLSRIYTKSGDKGETGLGDGTRVPKDHPRVAAYGGVDELNCRPRTAHFASSRRIRNRSCCAASKTISSTWAPICAYRKRADEPAGAKLRVRPEQSARLEAAIDRLNANLSPLTSFVLPGGEPSRGVVPPRPHRLPPGRTRRGDAVASGDDQPRSRRLPQSPLRPPLCAGPRLQQ